MTAWRARRRIAGEPPAPGVPAVVSDRLPERGMDPGAVLLALLGSPNLASRHAVFGQYDSTVGADTVAGPGRGAAVLRVKGTTKALVAATDAPYTLTFVGNDLRKIDTHEARAFLDGREIGTVLTCVTDVAIARHCGKIYSVASPNKPEGIAFKGLSCGFIKVKANLAPGTVVELRDGRRTIPVTIETDVRPDRTARKPLKNFM